MARKEFELKLREVRQLTPSTKHFVFDRVDGDPAKFTPGQFLMTHFEMDGETHQRSYSIATLPGQSTALEISVSYVEGGRGTRLLWGLNQGDVIRASGPYGRFVLRKENVRTYYLIGTGTGVAPYRTMLPEIAERIANDGLRVHLMLGVREPDELLFGKEWVEFMRKNPGFDFTACYSRVMPESPQHYERKGYVQQALAEMDLHPENDVVYLCGNPNMVDQAVELLTTTHAFSPYAIRREKYV